MELQSETGTPFSDVIDRLGDAGVATFNLAVDAVDEKPGPPKALNPIRSYFEHLVKRQYRYGYTVFFNMNICRNNMDDIRALTEIAREHRVATDYHINRCWPTRIVEGFQSMRRLIGKRPVAARRYSPVLVNIGDE